MATKPKYTYFSKNQIQNFINNAKSIEDILIQMKYNKFNDIRFINSVKKYCDSLDLDTSHLLLKNPTDFIICNNCKQLLPKIDFYLKPDGNIAQKVCKECVRKREKQKYRTNQDKIILYKQTHPCCKCGCNKFYLIDFHHKDPTKKDYAISENSHASFDTLLKEIDKCITLCANCHREFHYLNEHNGITLDEYLSD